MKSQKKAQLAVETLLIYGIAILVVMLAIGALISFGILDLGGLLPDTCSIQGASLSCDEYYFSKSSGLNMEITNNIGKNLAALEIISVRPSNTNDIGLISCDALPVSFTTDGVLPVGDGITSVCSDTYEPPTGFCVAPATEITLPPLINGEKGTLQAIDCKPVEQLKAGKKISLNFELNYKTVGSNLLGRPVSGKMRVTVVE